MPKTEAKIKFKLNSYEQLIPFTNPGKKMEIFFDDSVVVTGEIANTRVSSTGAVSSFPGSNFKQSILYEYEIEMIVLKAENLEEV